MFCSGHVLFVTCWRAYIVMGLYLLAHIMDLGFDQNKKKNKQKKHYAQCQVWGKNIVIIKINTVWYELAHFMC